MARQAEEVARELCICSEHETNGDCHAYIRLAIDRYVAERERKLVTLALDLVTAYSKPSIDTVLTEFNRREEK